MQRSTDCGVPVPSEHIDSTTPALKVQGILEKRAKKIVRAKCPRKLLFLLRERKRTVGA